MNIRKILLAATAAAFLTGAISPAIADGNIDGEETIFETVAAPEIQPASLPIIQSVAQPKTIAEDAFDLTDGR